MIFFSLTSISIFFVKKGHFSRKFKKNVVKKKVVSLLTYFLNFVLSLGLQGNSIFKLKKNINLIMSLVINSVIDFGIFDKK